MNACLYVHIRGEHGLIHYIFRGILLLSCAELLLLPLLRLIFVFGWQTHKMRLDQAASRVLYLHLGRRSSSCLDLGAYQTPYPSLARLGYCARLFLFDKQLLN